MKCQHCGNDIAGFQTICPICGSSAEGVSSAANNAVQTVKTVKTVPNINSPYQPQQTVQNTGNMYQPQQTVQNTGSVYPPQNVPDANGYPTPQYGQQPVPGYFPPQGLMKKSEFIKLPAMKKIRQSWKGVWIAGYVVIGINVLLSFLWGQPGIFVDIFIMLGLNLGIHLAFNRGCAIALLCYSLLNCIIMTVMMGTFSGWYIIALGVWAIKATFDFHKQWNIYSTTGVIPEYIG